ncbi:UNVERIFIED_ORG: hypothetical protein CLV66_109224 [Actinomadura viridilutea]
MDVTATALSAVPDRPPAHGPAQDNAREATP